MLEYWYDYAKQKYRDKANDRRFWKKIWYIKVWSWDTVLIGKSKKVIGLVKAKLGGRIMKEFLALRPKMYGSPTDDACADKKAKGTKRCIIKQELIIQRLQKLSEN